MIYHPGVTCGHVYKKESDHNTTSQDLNESYARLKQLVLSGQLPHQIHDLAWLVGKFDPVPTWERTFIPRAASTERVEWVAVNYA